MWRYRFAIFTDSLSSVQALSGFNPTDGIVQSIRLHIARLGRHQKEVLLCWVPSHVGVSGNEAADAAARRAAERPCSRRLPIPARDLFPHLTTHLRDAWQEYWEALVDNKLFEIKPKLGEWPSASRSCRREEVALCRLRTGHTLATHRYLLCGEARPQCSSCGAPLSVRHVLKTCTGFNLERATHLGQGQRPFSMTELIGRDTVRIRQVLSFLNSIDFRFIYSPG